MLKYEENDPPRLKLQDEDLDTLSEDFQDLYTDAVREDDKFAENDDDDKNDEFEEYEESEEHEVYAGNSIFRNSYTKDPIIKNFRKHIESEEKDKIEDLSAEKNLSSEKYSFFTKRKSTDESQDVDEKVKDTIPFNKKLKHRYPLGEVYDEYEDNETQEASSALKIVLCSMTILFFCILAGLVYKINSVNEELKTAKELLALTPSNEELEKIRSDSEKKTRTIESLTKQLNQIRAGETPEDWQGAQGDSSDTTTVYTVVDDDNLDSIAKRFHTTVANLQKWNNITNVNKINIGDKLRIAPPPGN